MSVDLPDEVFLAVNPRGVLIINPETKDVLSEYPYSEVRAAFACSSLVALGMQFLSGAGISSPTSAVVTTTCVKELRLSLLSQRAYDASPLGLTHRSDSRTARRHYFANTARICRISTPGLNELLCLVSCRRFQHGATQVPHLCCTSATC